MKKKLSNMFSHYYQSLIIKRIMDDFPSKLTIIILMNLNYSRRHSIKRVCKQWANLITIVENRTKKIWTHEPLNYEPCIHKNTFNAIINPNNMNFVNLIYHSNEQKDIIKLCGCDIPCSIIDYTYNSVHNIVHNIWYKIDVRSSTESLISIFHNNKYIKQYFISFGSNIIYSEPRFYLSPSSTKLLILNITDSFISGYLFTLDKKQFMIKFFTDVIDKCNAIACADSGIIAISEKQDSPVTNYILRIYKHCERTIYISKCLPLAWNAKKLAFTVKEDKILAILDNESLSGIMNWNLITNDAKILILDSEYNPKILLYTIDDKLVNYPNLPISYAIYSECGTKIAFQCKTYIGIWNLDNDVITKVDHTSPDSILFIPRCGTSIISYKNNIISAFIRTNDDRS